MKVLFQRTHPNAVIPSYAHGSDEDAGVDLVAIEDVYLHFAQPTLIKTGLRVQLPAGVEMQIRPRSGLALKEGITMMNAPGTVDPGYRGELNVIAVKLKQEPDGEPYLVRAGTRIAQAVFNRYVQADIVESTELSESARGENGFGSTGVAA